MAPGDPDPWVDAATSYDHTTYYAVLPAGSLAVALDLFGERLLSWRRSFTGASSSPGGLTFNSLSKTVSLSVILTFTCGIKEVVG